MNRTPPFEPTPPQKTSKPQPPQKTSKPQTPKNPNPKVGLPRYNAFRRALSLAPARGLGALARGDATVGARLAGVYGDDVEGVDLVVGLLGEDPIPGFIFGEVGVVGGYLGVVLGVWGVWGASGGVWGVLGRWVGGGVGRGAASRPRRAWHGRLAKGGGAGRPLR